VHLGKNTTGHAVSVSYDKLSPLTMNRFVEHPWHGEILSQSSGDCLDKVLELPQSLKGLWLASLPHRASFFLVSDGPIWSTTSRVLAFAAHSFVRLQCFLALKARREICSAKCKAKHTRPLSSMFPHATPQISVAWENPSDKPQFRLPASISCARF
jgi:hypothetical protein